MNKKGCIVCSPFFVSTLYAITTPPAGCSPGSSTEPEKRELLILKHKLIVKLGHQFCKFETLQVGISPKFAHHQCVSPGIFTVLTAQRTRAETITRKEMKKLKNLVLLAALAGSCFGTADAQEACYVNVALNKSATASASTIPEPPGRAIDGNMTTQWCTPGNNGWIALDLQSKFTVNALKLRVNQALEGNSVHEILVSSDLQTWTLVKTLSGFTVDKQDIAVNFNPALTNVRGVKINSTISNTSWLAWYEIKVLSTAPTPTVTRNNNTLTSSSATNNQWYLDGNPVSGATSQTYTATNAGGYQVGVTYDAGCVVFSDILNVPASRTVSVSADAAKGSAIITNNSSGSITSRDAVSVKATPATDYYFVNWTNGAGGAEVSTLSSYTYEGTSAINLTANFASNGAHVAPMESTSENPVYYYIFSAADGSNTSFNAPQNLGALCLLSNANGDDVVWGSPTPADDRDLWALIKYGDHIKLTNKATGKYFHSGGLLKDGSWNISTDRFYYSPYPAPNNLQYKIGNITYSSTIAGDNNDARGYDDLGVNSKSAWYFVAPALTGTDPATAANWTNGVLPQENMAVAIKNNASIASDKTYSGIHIAAGKSLSVNAGKGITVRNSVTGTGTLVLKSDAANGTATLIGNVSSAATVEQYLPQGSDREWWYLASPVTGAAWTVFGSNQVGGFSESARSFSTPFKATETLEAGKGYLVKLNASQAANTYQFTNKTLNNGNISVQLTRSVTGNLDNKRGFNLVGNPYPSYLNWEMAYNASTNIRSTIWYRTKGSSGMEFQTYNAALGVSVPTSASGYIPPMQAFWVKVDADPVLPETVSYGTVNFTNSMRGHANTSGNRLKSPAAVTLPMVRLELSNGTSVDETVLAFHENAQDDFDRYDSEKMSNAGATEIYSLIDNQEVVINAIAPVEGSKTIRMGIRPAASGNFSIRATELKNTEDIQLILIDHTLHRQTELLLNESYTFYTEAATSTDRFSIELRTPQITTPVDNISDQLRIFSSASGRITIEGTVEDKSEASVFNLPGQLLMTQLTDGNHTELNHDFLPGVYIVRINNRTYKVTVK